MPRRKSWWFGTETIEGDERSAVTARKLLPWGLGTALIFLALVALDQFVLHPGVLTTFRRIQPLSPLYAFQIPKFRPEVLLFVDSRKH